MTYFSRLLRAFPLLALSLVPACASDASQNAETGDGQDVVDIPNSKVKDQSIGNCWLYATSAWAESLRLGYSGEELNVSESYLSYLDWFHGIQAGDFDDKEGLQTGGWFGEAAEYMRRYGVMDEATFIPEEANSQESYRQKQALDAINASLKSGPLSDAATRKDPIKVRDELDKAWKLSPDVVSLLDESFGHDLSRTLVKGATVPSGKGIRKPSDLEVGYVASKKQTITLTDAIGEPSSDTSYGWKQRKGAFAWNESSYPSDAKSQRAFQIRAQKAMNDRRPAILIWFVDFNSMDRQTGTFKAVPAKPGHQGGHMTVLEDYQVSNVPGFGTLAAGTTVTDPKALEAALSPDATLDFLRIKNSWGTGFQPPEGTDLAGYHDLYLDYLNGQIPICDAKDASGNCTKTHTQRGLTSMVLPPDSWSSVTLAPAPGPGPDPGPDPKPETSCAHDLCSAGDKLTTDCDPCTAKVCDADPYCCNTKWDATCVNEVGSICEKTCELGERPHPPAPSPTFGEGAGGVRSTCSPARRGPSSRPC